MGRRREHDADTGAALLEAAERIVDADGLQALSVRRLAMETATTTRSVYTVFGSKAALIVALGCRAFDWLGTAVDAVPLTDDPRRDVVEAGAVAFRRLVTEHPSLFRVGIQRAEVPPELVGSFNGSAARALTRLESRLERLRAAGGLGDWATGDAIVAFHATCEGLAALEIRGLLAASDGGQMWRRTLAALVSGFGMAGIPSLGGTLATGSVGGGGGQRDAHGEAGTA